ncbi:MAG: DUF3098 domain-containing protein [Saprospiraceae bacterium]|nr:DUF3098 domain-containing protein [Saprospiraceae bacterium]
MSQDPKPLKKKVATTTRPSTNVQSQRRSSNTRNVQSFPLLFHKQNYLYMGIGCALIGLGLLLMLGGGMSDPNVWDESVIYSPRRITLAPIVILAGLGMQVYAIFKK